MPVRAHLSPHLCTLRGCVHGKHRKKDVVNQSTATAHRYCLLPLQFELASRTRHCGQTASWMRCMFWPMFCGLWKCCRCMGVRRHAHRKGYDPELPVLESAVLDILIIFLPHVVEVVLREGHSSGWKLLLTQADHTHTHRTL